MLQPRQHIALPSDHLVQIHASQAGLQDPFAVADPGYKAHRGLRHTERCLVKALLQLADLVGSNFKRRIS